MPKKEIPDYKRIDIFGQFEPVRIKFKDVFDLKDFHDTLHEWLLEYQWLDLGDDLDHYETFYGEVLGPNDVKNSIAITWRMWKKATRHSDNYKYYLDLYYRCIAISKIEVVKEGKKLNVNKGEVELKINACVEKVYIDKIKNNSLLNPFMGIINKRLYRKMDKQHEKELYQEVQVFVNFIKQYLKLKRYLPYEETKSFFSRAAWPSHQQETEE